MQIQAVRRGRLGLIILVTAIVALALMVIPRVALSNTPTLTVTSSTWTLGEGVTINANLAIDAANESFDAPKIRFFGSSSSAGSEDFTVALPVDEGYKDISDLLPVDGSGDPRGSLTVTVTHTNISNSTAAAGYSYGYTPAGAGAKIGYVITWTPPNLRYPVPATPAQITAPVKSFDMPGGGGGSANLSTTYKFDVPGVPGAPSGSEILGLAYDKSESLLFVLVDGANGGQDVIIEMDPTDGFMVNFTKITLPDGTTQVENAYDIAVVSNKAGWGESDVWVLAEFYGDPNANPPTQPSAKIFDPYNEASSATAANLTINAVNFPSEFPAGLAGMSDCTFPCKIVQSQMQNDIFMGVGTHEITLSDSSYQSSFTPASSTDGGFTDIAYDDSNYNLIGANGDKLAAFWQGMGYGSSNTDMNNIGGLAVKTTTNVLYIADNANTGGKIYTAVTTDVGGGGGGGGPKFPRAIAGTEPLYILQDNSPNDLVLTFSTAGVQSGSGWAIGSTNAIESMTLMGSDLYAINNGNPRQLYKFSTSGSIASGYPKNLPNFMQSIGGLTNDGTNLIAAESNDDTIHWIDPASATISESKYIYTNNMMLWTPYGLDGIAYVAPGGGATAYLLGVKYQQFFKINASSAELMEKFDVSSPPPYDQTGITQAGTSLYVVDSGTQAVYAGGVPGAPPPEFTSAGGYTARFSSVVGGTTTNADASFTVAKVGTLTITITSPSDGDAFTTTPITISGVVNDPTVTQVTLGIDLPSTDLYGPKKFESGDGGMALTGLWHRTDDFKNPSNPRAIGAFSMAYTQDADNGNAGKFNFDTGSPNTGNADTPTFVVGENTEFCSSHWYDNEASPDFDKMLVQIVKADTTFDTLYQIVHFTPPQQGGGMMMMFPQSGTFFNEGFVNHELVFIEPYRINWMAMDDKPVFTPLCKSLQSYLGQTVKIRFKFDSSDAWENQGEGWFIDNIHVTGAGAASGIDPLTVTNLAFSGPFALSEGSNAIAATARRTVYDAQTATTSIAVFLDKTTPIIAFGTLAAKTNNSILAVAGTWSENTPFLLKLTVGSKVYTLKKEAQFDQADLTFSQTVSLNEGSNSLSIALTDKGGLVGTSTATVILDTTAPVLTVLPPIYPVGNISARAGDPIVFQVKAEDASSGVASVVYFRPDNNASAPMDAVADIPEAVRDQWQVHADATHLLPIVVPSGMPAGSFSITVRAADDAGTSADSTVTGTIVAALQAYSVYLMPGPNLVSTPLIATTKAWSSFMTQKVPNINTTFKNTLTATGTNAALHLDSDGDATLANVITKVTYYTGGPEAAAGTTPAMTTPGTFPEYTPSTVFADTLTNLDVGKGYWITVAEGAFKESAPLASGLPTTRAPIKLTIAGQFLEPATVPPVFPVIEQWNLVGLHSEIPKNVGDMLDSIVFSSGASAWSSLLQYLNVISFNFEPQAGEKRVTMTQGQFSSLVSTEDAQLGRGFWLYVLDETGTITP